MKIAYWDIETWDLSAEFGPIICASVEVNGNMTTLRQDTYVKKGLAEDLTDDKQLCIDLRDILDSCNMHVGWYSKGFDIPHLNTRLAKHGERLLRPRLHLDCIWFWKGWRGLKAKSGKMKHVAEFLDIERKPDVSSEVWMKAKGGNKRAIDEVCRRCEADVRITRKITEKTMDLELVRNIQRYP